MDTIVSLTITVLLLAGAGYVAKCPARIKNTKLLLDLIAEVRIVSPLDTAKV